jgi:hypothetical protein
MGQTSRLRPVGRTSLEGVDLKLNRAQDNFHALSQEISEFLAEPDHCKIALNREAERRTSFRVADFRRPPPEWGVRIGECVHHYRSALDHLAFQLVLANTRGRLPAKVVKRSEFPIFNSGPKFRGKLNRKGVPSSGSGRAKIQDIAVPAQAIIESLQPYHRRKKSGARVLWDLHELANIDKHRILHLTHAAVHASSITVTEHRNVAALGEAHFRPRALKRDAVVAEVEIIPIDPRLGVQMNMEADISTDIVFGKSNPVRSVRGASVLKTLFDISTFIADDVLPPLADLLGLESTFKPGSLIDLKTLSRDEVEALGARVQVGPVLTFP